MSMKLDTSEFQRALLRYIPTTKRDLPEIVNKRAINVAFKAIRFTPKAKPGRVRRQLKKAGKNNAPVAALLLNKIQGYYGNAGYYGAKMREEVDEFIAGKVRSIGYMKSGWLAAAKKLARLAGQRAGRSRAAKVYGEGEHGQAKAAKTGWTPTALIINRAVGIADVGQVPLQQALNAEAKEILKHVERKMKKSARRHGIRTR